MRSRYTLEKIKFGVEPQDFKKAADLYSSRKVTHVKADGIGYSAVVLGTKPYHVYVHKTDFDRGMCTCYLGEKDILCKHMIALAIHAVLKGKPILLEDLKDPSIPMCSGILGELSKENLAQVKKEITNALRYIKYYNGPSKTWFAYQNSLSEGCRMLGSIFSKLPVSTQTTKLIITTLLRIDDKILHGVDDSDGEVGNFIKHSVRLLLDFIKCDPACKKACDALRGIESSFGWEEPLI